MEGKSISRIINKSIAMIIIVLLLTQGILLAFIAFISRDYKHGIANAAADKLYTILENEFTQIESISDNMVKNGCLVDFITDRQNNDIYDYLDVVKNNNDQFIYAVFLDAKQRDVQISNDISRSDYELLINTAKNGEFFENRGAAVIDTPYNEALLISKREIESFNFDELRMETLGSLYICSKINLNKIISEFEGDVDILSAEFVSDNLSDIRTEQGDIVINKPFLNYSVRCICRPRSGPNTNYYKICIAVIFGEMFLLLAIILLLYRSFSSEIQRPIQELIRYLDDYEAYEDSKMIKVKGAKEIEHICTHIRSFAEKMHEQTRQIFTNQQKMYEMEILNSEYRYEALRSQINPHFLYNAINCMHGMAGYYKIPQIMRICEGMSAILRYSLDTSKYVTLSEEMDIIEKYIDIMRIRFDSDFETKIDIEPRLGRMRIIKMSLQPAVENAFIHGEFYKLKKKGVLEIKAKEDEERLIVTIVDNGKGITPGRLRRLRNDIDEQAETGTAHGLGLRNVNLRIKSEYGKDYGIEIDSCEGEYTAVRCNFKIKDEDR